MVNNFKKEIKGFTLIEMLLVIVIIGTIIYASMGYIQQKTMQMRIDRASSQMQQILNAALSFYITNGKWPTTIATDLQGVYLPPTTVPLISPWGEPYTISVFTPTVPAGQNVPPPQVYVWTPITATLATSGSATAAANVIAGTLPLSYTTTDATGTKDNPPVAGTACTAASTTCYVVASVNIPGQSLNTARAVNFAGLYHHGSCVPVPQCPVDNENKTMEPQIMVVPVSVSGLNDASSTNVYPISSFTAYATGNKPPDLTPPDCKGFGTMKYSTSSSCTSDNEGEVASAYWRVCLQVVTERGNVQETNNTIDYGKNVTLMAITRCVVQGEPQGSTFNVYSN